MKRTAFLAAVALLSVAAPALAQTTVSGTLVTHRTVSLADLRLSSPEGRRVTPGPSSPTF
jgi:hypothetical protein